MSHGAALGDAVQTTPAAHLTPRIRSFFSISLDGTIWVVATLVSIILRYDFDLSLVTWLPTICIGLLAGLGHAALGSILGLYVGRYKYGSFDEVKALTITVFIVSILTLAVVTVIGFRFGVPRSAIPVAAVLSLLLMFGARYLYRVTRERNSKPPKDAVPVLVVGAGHTGNQVVRLINFDARSQYRAVGLLDDDPAKSRLHLHGVPVLGRTKDIARVAKRTGAEALVLAITDASPALLSRLSDDGSSARLRVLVTPQVQEVSVEGMTASDLRSINIEDLLGRVPITTDLDSVASYVTGKRVLVTGAGGSIGSELCRQLHQLGPKELIMLDRDETGLQQAQISILGHGLLNTRDVVLSDIRDEAELTRVFLERRPHVVFHAAALKHLPMLEQYPEEAWKTNVLGTLNVINAANKAGVSTFVNISTDKAANPTSALGHSKRVAEKITAWAAEETGLQYLSVRFGNVIGSRGSMLPTFQSLIESGGPVTVTHPDATRYFMTIPEACQLVVQAGSIGRPGEVLILDMGEPVRILDVARRMIAMSGKQVDIVFTGLREGEKLHEVLVGTSEELARPFHPKISHTHADSVLPSRLDKDVWLQRMRDEREWTSPPEVRPLPPIESGTD